MKHFPVSLKFLGTAVLLALLAACVSPMQEAISLTAAAGFKIITPTKPDQETILKSLPPDTVTQVTYEGKIYYVLPDAKNNQAWVGGPAEYQEYQKLRAAKQIIDQNLAAAQMNELNQANWGGWGGWGATGGFRRY